MTRAPRHPPPPKGREDTPRPGLRDKSSRASSALLEDRVTMLGSVGQTEEYGNESYAGSTEHEACAG
jgi:hypothetical protein